MKINIIIPAKGTSERIQNKNLLKINNQTLVYQACKKVLSCKFVDNVYLDTESDEIKYEVKDLLSMGLKLIHRPACLANNDIGANEMMIYGLHSISDCDLLLQTFCTSPLLKAETIDKCIQKYLDEGYPKYDSFFTVLEMQEYFWQNNKPMNFSTKRLPNSFELDKMYMETHGLYGIMTSALIETKTRVGKNPMLLPISRLQSLDINIEEDLKLVKRVMNAS